MTASMDNNGIRVIKKNNGLDNEGKSTKKIKECTENGKINSRSTIRK